MYTRVTLPFLLLMQNALADSISGKGLIGYGIELYTPACAFACVYSLSNPLNCSTADLTPATDATPPDEALPSGPGWNVTASPSPACQAKNLVYLTTVAFCLQSNCKSLSPIALESFWASNVPSSEDGTHPNLSYAQTIDKITEPPTRDLNITELLNYTAIVPADVYQPYADTLAVHGRSEVTHSTYALVLLLSGAALPILMSFGRLIPFPAAIVTKFNAYLIDPPLLANPHPIQEKLFVIPTRGQAIFIVYLFIINITLSICGLELISDNILYPGRVQAWTYIANRTGVLCYANLPLVILYAGRNNILLWLTNWSRTTFLLLHRYNALICTLHAAVHGCLYLNIALRTEGWAEEFTSPYWYYGSSGAIAFAILVLSSIKWIRVRAYELFILVHIVITVVAIVCSYKHVVEKYEFGYGYQNWIWMTVAFWAFDRGLRLVRQIRHGFPKAYITLIDDEYYRVDIPGVSTSGYAYLHFPMVSTWRMWESHPFSIASVSYTSEKPEIPPSPNVCEETAEKSKSGLVASTRSASFMTSSSECGKLGIVLFIRRQKGLTQKLAMHQSTRVLVESSYGHNFLSLHDDTSPSQSYPNVICIAGGVGITGVLPALGHFHGFQQVGGKKLYWGTRTWPLVNAVQDMLGLELSHWPGVDVTLSVGERLNLRELLEKDLEGGRGTMIVACGPESMMDDVRSIVSGLTRHNGAVVKLVIECFAW